MYNNHKCHLMENEEDNICIETNKICDFANPDDPEAYMNYCEHYNDYMGR